MNAKSEEVVLPTHDKNVNREGLLEQMNVDLERA